MTTPAPSVPPVRYDAAIIEQMAKRLLDRASMLVGFYTVLGIILGLLLLAGVSSEFAGGTTIGWLGLILFAAIGYAIGNGRAFSLRLQAHLLLCQVNIERNTSQLIQLMGGRRQ